MRVPCQEVPLHYSLLLLIVAAVMVAMAFPLAAADPQKKIKKECLAFAEIINKQPTAVDRGFAFGYIELTLQIQWGSPKKGLKGIKNEEAHDLVLLGQTANSDRPDVAVVSCNRGQGNYIFASNLPPGEVVIKSVFNFNVRGWKGSIDFREPIRFEVSPSSATFIGSIEVVGGPVYAGDRYPTLGATVTRRDLEGPTAASLASELAPLFGQPWRSYLETVGSR